MFLPSIPKFNTQIHAKTNHIESKNFCSSLINSFCYHFVFCRAAREEPILSVPSVHGAEDVSTSMRFLVLMSRGVYNAYEQATGVSKEEVLWSVK